MTKNFNTSFTYLGQTIIVSKAVTDRMEDRETSKKKVYACEWMTQMLRSEGLFQRSCIHAKDLVEVKKSEMVSWKDTVAQIKEAERAFKENPASIDKLVILSSNACGYTL